MPRIHRSFLAGFLFTSLAIVQALPAQSPSPSVHGSDQERARVPGLHGGDSQDSQASFRKQLTNSRQGVEGRDTAMVPATVRIVAVGDLHGDAENTRKVLRMAGVIDEFGAWTNNVDYLVQTGDIIDRGDDTIFLYKYMDDLRNSALAEGSNVLSLMGNHEYMNLQGKWEDVSDSEKATFGTDDERRERLRSGDIGQSWAKYYKVALRLPLHPSLGPPNTDHDPKKASPLPHAAIAFVHGGLSPFYTNLTPFPSAINKIGRSAMQKLQQADPDTLTAEEEELLNTGDSPIWYRGWADDPEDQVCDEVDEILLQTGTRRMIMGHTPQDEIVSRCDGKIIIIDTGISPHYGGHLSALSIEYTIHQKPMEGENQRSVWIEHEDIKAIYPNKYKLLLNSWTEIEMD